MCLPTFKNVEQPKYSEVSITFAATFDVQNPVVESVGDNMISISLEFIDESIALGCFVVFEDHFSTEDTFVVLKRNAMDSIYQFQLQITPRISMILKIMHFLIHTLLFLLFKL